MYCLCGQWVWMVRISLVLIPQENLRHLIFSVWSQITIQSLFQFILILSHNSSVSLPLSVSPSLCLSPSACFVVLSSSPSLTVLCCPLLVTLSSLWMSCLLTFLQQLRYLEQHSQPFKSDHYFHNCIWKQTSCFTLIGWCVMGLWVYDLTPGPACSCLCLTELSLYVG